MNVLVPEYKDYIKVKLKLDQGVLFNLEIGIFSLRSHFQQGCAPRGHVLVRAIDPAAGVPRPHRAHDVDNIP